MRQNLLITLLGATALISGCATKNYVRQNVDPVQAKLDKVADQTNKQGVQLTQTDQDVAKNSTAISATDEKATAADRRAGDALNSAGQANQKSDRNAQDINQLRGVIANIDDYKVAKEATVLFPFNRATLSKDDQQTLDTLVSESSSYKRYFVAVQGYTDQTGSAEYNLELSKKRADAVVQYLAGQRNVPFYQIRTIGLGEEQLADPGKTRDARAKNRRVEVKIYSADQVMAAGSTGGSR